MNIQNLIFVAILSVCCVRGEVSAEDGKQRRVSGLDIPQHEVFFHAGFDKSANATNAADKQIVAAFSGQSKSESPQFVPGVWGQALRLGKADGVSWADKAANLPQTGSLLFWFRPQWPVVLKGRRVLLMIPGFRGGLTQFPTSLSVFGPILINHGSRGGLAMDKFWTDKHWHQCVFTWSANGERRLYFDGDLVDFVELPLLKRPDGFSLSLAAGTKAVAGWEGDVDELTVLSRELRHSEVEAAYVAGLTAQKRLIGSQPAIRVDVAPSVEVASTYRKNLAYPELFTRHDGTLLLRADERESYGASNQNSSDVFRFALPEQSRWFRGDKDGLKWAAVASPFSESARIARLSGGPVLAIGDTATHKVQGVFEGLVRRRNEKSQSFGDPVKTVFRIGIEPEAGRRLHLNRSVVRTADGTLILTGYVLPKGEKKCRLLLLASTDNGQTWSIRSTVWQDDRFGLHAPGGIGAPRFWGPTEASLLRSSKNRILCVFRTDAALLMTESTDAGRSWSSPRKVGPDGVSPTLVKLGDLIALAYGRPDINVAFSDDGGQSWFGFTDLLPVDRLRVEAAAMVAPFGHANYVSSGHVSLVANGANRLLLAYDTNWIIDAQHALPRNSVWVVPISVKYNKSSQSATHRVIPVADASVTLSGTWDRTAAASFYRRARTADSKLRFEFTGSGVSLLHPTFFDGGRWQVTLDGRQLSHVDLRTPQTKWGRRTLLADGLPNTKHVLELTPLIKTHARSLLNPNVFGYYEPIYPALFAAAGRTRAVLHGFEVW